MTKGITVENIEKIVSDKLNEGLMDELETSEILKKQAQAIHDALPTQLEPLDESEVAEVMFRNRHAHINQYDCDRFSKIICQKFGTPKLQENSESTPKDE